MMVSWAARTHDVICVSPSGKFGGQFGVGPWRLVPDDPRLLGLLNQLDIPHSTSRISGDKCMSHAALWIQRDQNSDKDLFLHVPEAFTTIKSADLQAMNLAQAAKFDRVRTPPVMGMLEPEWTLTPSQYVDFDYNALTMAVAADTDLHQGSLCRVDVNNKIAYFIDDEGDVFEETYDRLVITCPIAVFNESIEHTRFTTPAHTTSTIDLAFVEAEPRGTYKTPDHMLSADVVWTPFAPTIMRLTHHTLGGGSAYCVEFKAGASLQSLRKDLDSILGERYKVKSLLRGVRGPVIRDSSESWRLDKRGIHAIGPHATGVMTPITTALATALKLFGT